MSSSSLPSPVLLRTVLHDIHVRLGGHLTGFAGYELPTHYENRGAIVEHVHTRTACSWFDVSHMLVCDIVSPTASADLARLSPTLFDDLHIGQSRYCVLTREDAGVVDDTIVTRRADGLRLVLNAACAQNDVAHLVAHLGDAVRPRTDLGIVAMQGPTSVEAITTLGTGLELLAFMESAEVVWRGETIQVARSGYTGEDGFEVIAPLSILPELSEYLLSLPNVAAAGLAARDSLRLEAGLCLYGSELSPTISPIEAGLTWTIPRSRRAGGDYAGSEILSAQLATGPSRRLVAIAPRGRRPVRSGATLSADGVLVGVVTSGGWSPTLSRPIALALVAAAHYGVGTELVADVRGHLELCDIVPLPFVPHRYVKRPAASIPAVPAPSPTLASSAPSPSLDAVGEMAFVDRHIGPDGDDVRTMLAALGVGSLDELISQTVPAAIRLDAALHLGEARSETDALAELRAIADRNVLKTSLIGLGYSGTIVPPVVLRNVLENPAWYTAYTPYQPEISQGRLEALLNFQTMVADLTGMDMANASLLDEATAAAEAMTLARRQSKVKINRFVVDSGCHPHVIAVVQTRTEPLDIEVAVVSATEVESAVAAGAFGVLLAWPATTGAVVDHRAAIAAAHSGGALVCVTTDLLACTLLEPPGAWGADVVVGSAQRFGVPFGFGGPHAGFFAVRDAHKRAIPGRLVGVSADSHGRVGLRLALQTREQHIRRDKATSNICTAQVLLAVMAGLYACWHGPDGLRHIAEQTHQLTTRLAHTLADAGFELVNEHWFDTIAVRTDPDRAARIMAEACERGINLRLVDPTTISIACDQTTTESILEQVVQTFGLLGPLVAARGDNLDSAMVRTVPLLTHPVFSRYRSETEMLRYLRRLADKDLALDRTMIPLGSCTMKLNATTEMIPVTWPEFANMHPFAPADQAAGYHQLLAELERMLVEITGYDAVSLQPNAGSQGEFAGLLAIRAYHRSRGDRARNVCLIPSSAHGTNAASAVMCGMSIVVVACDEKGNVDLDDLTRLIDLHANALAALMITYPSTHGVFEEAITTICQKVHAAGGQVYLDGANLNALVGLAKPGLFGADVSHLNLHKTFCIPHGGGGPGVGPVCVRAHLAPFLPGHPSLVSTSSAASEGNSAVVGPLTSAPYGSAGILPIPWMYITMMGGAGLQRATELAILNANYIAHRLAPAFPVLYSGVQGRVAHECILDVRPITAATGVTVEDVAKRLVDYGFHAPTMSFPVAGTLMVEPTESESLTEIDRFCDAMIAIRAEIDRVAAGEWPDDDNPLRNAPHTAEDVTADEWAHPYHRSLAAYPVRSLRTSKYWPPISRINNALGDREVICSCPPLTDYS